MTPSGILQPILSSKMGKPSSFFLTAVLIDSLEFCEIWIPPATKSAKKTSNKKVNNFRVVKIMVIHISNSNHRHMTHFINDFLFRQTINIPFIKFINKNKKLSLKRSFFKLHIRRSRLPIFCKRYGIGFSNKSFNFW